MTLIITGIFIQFLGLAIQVIQLWQASAGTPPPGYGDAAQACLERERQDLADD